MTREERNQCRDIARQIVSDKNLLDNFKSHIELAALVDCAKNNDPHPSYDYAYSYQAIIEYLLEFETKLKPEWINPALHPNGKMTDVSAAEKSKTISEIKGQLRIDRGAKVRDERLAGFYAWLNAKHPTTCADFHNILIDSVDEDEALDIPNLLNDAADKGVNSKTPNWNALLSAKANNTLVTLIDYERFSFNLVKLSRSSRNDVEIFDFGAEFVFGINSPFEGHIIALQTYKGKTYALPLSTNTGLTALKAGQNFYPADADGDEVIPLCESTDVGLHDFIFLLFKGTPPYFDFTALHEAGEAIHAAKLEALATKLKSHPDRLWQLARIKVDFR